MYSIEPIKNHCNYLVLRLLLAVVFSPMIHCESGAGRAGKC